MEEMVPHPAVAVAVAIPPLVHQEALAVMVLYACTILHNERC